MRAAELPRQRLGPDAEHPRRARVHRHEFIVQLKKRVLRIGGMLHDIRGPHSELDRMALCLGQIRCYVADLVHLTTLNKSGFAGVALHRALQRLATVQTVKARHAEIDSSLEQLSQ